MSKKILIIDGNENITLMLKKYFEAEGYNALTSDTGSLAFKIANLEKPEVVLSEVFLPDMDGIELCKRIRDISVIPDVPYVFLSSVSDFLIENKAFRAGADEFLVKNNTTRQELLLRIELLLHQNAFSAKIERFPSLLIAGRIGEISLGEVVEFIYKQKLSGGLELFVVDQRGILFFDRGEIIDAYYGKRKAYRAIDNMCDEKAAVYRFSKNLFSRKKTITDSTVDLISSMKNRKTTDKNNFF